MTKFFASLLLALPIAGFAKDTNNVWLPFTGGNLETICRKVWDTYDNYFGTSTVLQIKQGASGEIAIRDMLDSEMPSKSVCAGSTMVLYNQYTLPDTKTRGHEIEMLAKVAGFPIVWYVPNSTPTVTTLAEYASYLKKLNRPINVGVWQGPNKTVVQHLAKTYNLNFNLVTYKNGPQMYPNLYDGSIDLAFDTGGGISVAESGKFKIVGYTATGKFTRLQGYTNFSQQDKELANIESWFGIAVPASTPKDVKEQLARRLEFIVRDEKFSKFTDSQLGSASGINGNELKKNITQQSVIIKKHWQ